MKINELLQKKTKIRHFHGLHRLQYIGSSNSFPCGNFLFSWKPHVEQDSLWNNIELVGKLHNSQGKPEMTSVTTNPGLLHWGQVDSIF